MAEPIRKITVSEHSLRRQTQTAIDLVNKSHQLSSGAKKELLTALDKFNKLIGKAEKLLAKFTRHPASLNPQELAELNKYSHELQKNSQEIRDIVGRYNREESPLPESVSRPLKEIARRGELIEAGLERVNSEAPKEPSILPAPLPGTTVESMETFAGERSVPLDRFFQPELIVSERSPREISRPAEMAGQSILDLVVRLFSEGIRREGVAVVESPSLREAIENHIQTIVRDISHDEGQINVNLNYDRPDLALKISLIGRGTERFFTAVSRKLDSVGEAPRAKSAEPPKTGAEKIIAMIAQPPADEAGRLELARQILVDKDLPKAGLPAIFEAGQKITADQRRDILQPLVSILVKSAAGQKFIFKNFSALIAEHGNSPLLQAAIDQTAGQIVTKAREIPSRVKPNMKAIERYVISSIKSVKANAPLFSGQPLTPIQARALVAVVAAAGRCFETIAASTKSAKVSYREVAAALHELAKAVRGDSAPVLPKNLTAEIAALLSKTGFIPGANPLRGNFTLPRLRPGSQTLIQWLGQVEKLVSARGAANGLVEKPREIQRLFLKVVLAEVVRRALGKGIHTEEAYQRLLKRLESDSLDEGLIKAIEQVGRELRRRRNLYEEFVELLRKGESTEAENLLTFLPAAA